MDKKLLEEFVSKGLSQYKIADIVGCSQTKIKYWLWKHKLKTLNCNAKLKKCAICGEADLKKFYKHKDGRFRYRCRKCDNSINIDRFKGIKKQAVEYKGGKCVVCGYDKCMASLDFHHRNPEEKDPHWRKMRNWIFEKIKNELDKCDLVCKNCHGEIHAGMHKGRLA